MCTTVCVCVCPVIISESINIDITVYSHVLMSLTSRPDQEQEEALRNTQARIPGRRG